MWNILHKIKEETWFERHIEITVFVDKHRVVVDLQYRTGTVILEGEEPE